MQTKIDEIKQTIEKIRPYIETAAMLNSYPLRTALSVCVFWEHASAACPSTIPFREVLRRFFWMRWKVSVALR